MATTTVGKLRAELTLDSQKFTKGIDKSKKKLKGLNKGFDALKGSLAGILSAGILVKLTKNALDFADAIGKSAERIGITTDRLQELRFAFDRAGVSAETVDKGLLNFGKRLGKAKDGFGALAEGLKRTDSELLKNVLSAGSMEDSLDLIFKAMGNATTQAQKLAIADAAFGKAGLLMTAAFDDANKTFEKSIKLGRSLGIVLDKNLIANAQKTNDTLSALAQVLKIQFFDLLLRLSPLIGKTAQALIDMAKGLQKVIGSIVPAVAETAKLKEKAKELKEQIADINAHPLNFLGGSREFVKKKAQEELKEIEKILKARQEVLDAGKIKGGKTSQKKTKEQLFNESKAYEKVGESAEAAADSVKGFFTAAGTEQGQRGPLSEIEKRAKEIADSVITDSERIDIAVQKIKDVFNSQENRFGNGEQGRILSSETAQKAIDNLQKVSKKTKDTNLELQGFFIGIGQSTENAIVNAVTGATSALEGLKATAKAIIDDILRLFIRNSFIKPLFGGGSGGSGLIQQGFSAATKFLGFASGGQFTVGGQGGIDNNLVAFKASKGERVTVEPPGQQTGSGVTVVQNLNFSLGVQSTVRAEVMNMLPTINASAKSAVLDAKQRGGAFGEAFA